MRAVLFLSAVAALAQTPGFDIKVVEDSSGNPLASAEVRFHRIGQRELAADLDTDRSGRLQVSGLAPGDYTVDISKPNYITASLKLTLPTTGVSVRLVRYAIISGQVADSQGRAALGRIQAPGGRTIGGARVTIVAKSDAGYRTVREVELADGGRYRIYDLPPGEYAVALWYDNLRDGSGVLMYPDLARPRIFAIAGGEEFHGIDFQLAPRPAFRISGTVQLPKPKTRVALALGLPDQPLLPIAQTITSGDDGAFRFERVPAGTYDLYVAGPDAGYGAHDSVLGPEPFFGRTRVSVAAADVTGLDLAVAPGRTLTVKLAGDKPPEGCPQSISLTAEPAEPWGIRSGRAVQIAYGKEQTLKDLTPGRVRLLASELGNACYQPDPPVLDLSAGSPPPAAISLASAGSLRGVLRGAAGGSRYTVVLLPSDSAPDSEARLATPAPDGKFAFDALRPGRYRIAAVLAAGEPRARMIADLSRMIEIQIAGGGPTDIELPAPPEGGRQ